MEQNNIKRAYLKHYTCHKDRVYRNNSTGAFVAPLLDNDDLIYAEPADGLHDHSLQVIRALHKSLFFIDTAGAARKLKLREVWEGRAVIAAHHFRYFGVCIVNTQLEILSASTVWCNANVRRAADESDGTFRALIYSRNFFSNNPTAKILSMQFIKRGVDVTDPVTGNISCCNLFCVIDA